MVNTTRATNTEQLVSLLRSTVEMKVMAKLSEAVHSAVVEATDGVVKAVKVPTDRVALPTLKRPVSGGKCAAVWDKLDEVLAAGNGVPTLAEVRKLAKRHKWNANNAKIEYYRWRKFVGEQPTAAVVRTSTYNGPDRRMTH